MSRKLVYLALPLVLAATVLVLLKGIGALEGMAASPYAADDICFVEERLGAAQRFTAFTPVRCSDESVKIGDSFGADYASLDFEDVDDDGRPEAIISSSSFRCKYGPGPCYDAWRIVVRVHPGSDTVFTVIERRYLKELTPGV
ncbi:hypothetical protein WMF27_46280 [Sorangium sp. So ce281]|uniref:hypothetical protein n=1 Tax=unclassified Sorangium TaxID=2621164 RepID=UPI003F5F9213